MSEVEYAFGKECRCTLCELIREAEKLNKEALLAHQGGISRREFILLNGAED